MLLHGPVVVVETEPLEIASQLVAAVARPRHGLPASSRSSRARRAWIGSGCASASSPCPEGTCRSASRAGRARGLYAWRGGSASWTLREVCPRLNMRVVTLAGGTGAASSCRGLAACVDPRAISPSSATPATTRRSGTPRSRPTSTPSTYALAGTARRRARAGASPARRSTACARHGRRTAPTRWFNLGDRDLATHPHRAPGRSATASPSPRVTRADRRRSGRRRADHPDERRSGPHDDPDARRAA